MPVFEQTQSIKALGNYYSLMLRIPGGTAKNPRWDYVDYGSLRRAIVVEWRFVVVSVVCLQTEVVFYKTKAERFSDDCNVSIVRTKVLPQLSFAGLKHKPNRPDIVK